jgi:RsiW-degrading membrane proteinase PrsW (M82 family)
MFKIIIIFIVTFCIVLTISRKLNKSWLAYALLGIELTILGGIWLIYYNQSSRLLEPFIILLGFVLVLVSFVISEDK